MTLELPDGLLKAVRSRQCILFVGSGLSVKAGYPSWSQLVASLYSEATGQSLQPGTPTDVFEMAEIARARLNPHEVVQVLRNLLGRPVPPTKAHRIISQTNYSALFTLNYDKLLETTLTQQRRWAPRTLTPAATSALERALSDPEFFLFKLHGDTDSPESIILTSRDYQPLVVHNYLARGFLQTVFLNSVLLFVGSSLHDPEFQLALSQLGPLARDLPFRHEHYAYMPDTSAAAPDEGLRMMNIRTIPFGPGDEDEQMIALLEQVRAEAPPIRAEAPYTSHP